MVYSVPLADGRIIYMRGEENDVFCIINILTVKLLPVWDEIQKNDRSQADWYRKKYHDTETCFAQSAICPVHLPEGGEYFDYTPNIWRLRFADGITRAQWLIDNGAQSFPMFFSHRQHEQILNLIGENFR